MMHGREKSDLAIGAAKPANNDGRPSAELVEQRAGTEGNAGQDRTRRAQSRASVSQGLDRVRRVSPSAPEVGAECANRACSDLCGGRPVMGVPTAINPSLLANHRRLSKMGTTVCARERLQWEPPPHQQEVENDPLKGKESARKSTSLRQRLGRVAVQQSTICMLYCR